MRGRGIGINRCEMVLLSIGLKIEQEEAYSNEIEMKGMEDLMGVKWNTLLGYLGFLHREGYIEKITRVPYRVKCTVKGINEYRELKMRIWDIELDCSRYDLVRNVEISYFLKNISAIEIMIPLLSELQKSSGFDIIDYVNIKSGLKDGSRFISMTEELNDENRDSEGLLSLKSTDLDAGPERINRFDRLLLESDIMRRQGDVEGAMNNYQRILENIGNLKNGRCAMAEFGLIQAIRYQKGIEDAMKRIDRSLQMDISNNLRGLLKRLKADMFSDLGEYRRSLELYRSAMGHFHASNAYNLLSICLNNIAVMYFRNNDFDKAESTWKKARSIATKWDIPCARAVVLVNLADVDARNRRIRTARRKLKEARKLFNSMGDLEGISSVDFNEALVNIEDNSRDASITSFDNAMRFPLQYYPKRDERWNVFRDRFQEKGWVLPNHLKTPPLGIFVFDNN